MGLPVVHFEVIGTDAEALRNYYGELFGWEFDVQSPMNYGLVDHNKNPTGPAADRIGTGISGGVGAAGPGGKPHVTFYVAAPDIEAALAKAEELGGTRVFGPEKIMDSVELGLFEDPEGNLIGVVNGEG